MKRIVSMLISSAMILGIVIVALSASSAEFCGISVSLVDNITLSDDATTATMQGGSKEQGYFTIPLDTIGNGDFSIEFDYNITICESPRALNFEGHDAEGNYPVIVIPAGNHARLEGTVGGAWKFIVDGTLKQTGSFSAAFDRPMKIGFTNTNRTGSFEATVSNLKINEESGAEPSETTILFDFEDGIVGNSYRSGNLSCKEGYLTVAELGCAKNKVIKLYSDSAENSADGFIYFSAPYASFGDKFVAEFDYKVVKAGVKSFTIETKTPAGGWFTPRIETSSDWAHFAIVMNKTSGQYNIYLNGESKSSGSFDNNGTNDEPFKIGITDTANQEFEIYIDNVRFTSGTTPKA